MDLGPAGGPVDLGSMNQGSCSKLEPEKLRSQITCDQKVRSSMMSLTATTTRSSSTRRAHHLCRIKDTLIHSCMCHNLYLRLDLLGTMLHAPNDVSRYSLLICTPCIIICMILYLGLCYVVTLNTHHHLYHTCWFPHDAS